MSLARQAFQATFWVAATTYLGQLIAFLAGIALMRLIAPEAFGVLSLAVFFATLARKLVGFGFNHALIHRQEDLPAAAGTHLFLHAASALLVIVAGILAFPAVFAHYDRLTASVLIAVAIGAGFEIAGYTPRIMLEKQVAFRGLQLANLGINFGTNLLAVLAALIWPNVWVLVGRLAAAQLAGTVCYWRLNRRLPLALPTWPLIHWFLRFGAPLWVSGLATFAVLEFDDFLVGTLIDEKTLGYYARAYALAVLPTTMITHIVARVAFPLYSRVQNDPEKLSLTFTTVMRFIVLMSAPAAIGLAYTAPEFVAVIYGETWRPMAALVRYLLLYELLRPIFDDVGELLTAVGQPRKVGFMQTIQAVAVLLLAPPLVYFAEAEGAAISVGLVMLLGVVLAYRLIRPHVKFDVIEVVLTPMVLCLLAASGAALLLWRFPVAGTGWRLMAKIGFFAGCSLLLFAVVQGRLLWREYRWFKEQIKPGKGT